MLEREKMEWGKRKEEDDVDEWVRRKKFAWSREKEEDDVESVRRERRKKISIVWQVDVCSEWTDCCCWLEMMKESEEMIIEKERKREETMRVVQED